MHNGVFLPGGTTIFSCPRSISRSEKYFARGKEFIPERWYIQKDLVIREKAMVAFNWGQWNCVGKQMALIELRVLIAHLVHGFEIEFASKDEQRRMEEECKDYVIMKCPPLHVNFKKLN